MAKEVFRLGHSPKVVDVSLGEREEPITPFRRYKTEALKKYEHNSLKSVFNRLSVDLRAKEEIEEKVEKVSRPSHPVIFIKDFSDDIRREKRDTILMKYRLANRNKINHLLTPVYKEESGERSKSKDEESIKQKLASKVDR